MRRGAILVNGVRGGLLDYDAVCDALESGHLRAAAFDVYDPEPPAADARLFRAERGAVAAHRRRQPRNGRASGAIGAAEVGRWLRGEPLRHVAEPGTR